MPSPQRNVLHSVWCRWLHGLNGQNDKRPEKNAADAELLPNVHSCEYSGDRRRGLTSTVTAIRRLR